MLNGGNPYALSVKLKLNLFSNNPPSRRFRETSSHAQAFKQLFSFDAQSFTFEVIADFLAFAESFEGCGRNADRAAQEAIEGAYSSATSRYRQACVIELGPQRHLSAEFVFFGGWPFAHLRFARHMSPPNFKPVYTIGRPRRIARGRQPLYVLHSCQTI